METYQVAVWNAFLNNICGASATFTTNRGKANAFMKEYAAVNRLRFNKEEPHPTAEIHAEIPDCRRKLLRCLEIGGAR